MDGNGRWAQQRGLKRTDGHAAGEEALFDTVEGALASAKAQPFDAAIVDLNLKGQSGRDVVVRLPGAIPIIIFSGTVGQSFQLERIRPRNPQLKLEDFAADASLPLVRALPQIFFGSKLRR